MALEFEHRVVEVVRNILGASLGVTPDWLIRPGRSECGRAWEPVCRIYNALTGLELPDVMRRAESRKVDAVLKVGEQRRVLEVDEKQHFNVFRAESFRHYPEWAEVAFDVGEWRRLSANKTKLEGGGFAKAKPPLFPELNGRHKQRAFRDALCDLLPPLHGFAPTLRISAFEAISWIGKPNATVRMEALLRDRMKTAA
jgi:hypothetical protein